MKRPTRKYRGKQRPLRQREPDVTRRPIICYDLETTRIQAGSTPEPLYLTVESCERGQVIGIQTTGYDALADAIITYMLTDTFVGYRFVAFNANKFDMYIVWLALSRNPAYSVEAYFNKTLQIRGGVVTLREQPKKKWYFSDAMAMFAFAGTLEKFVETYGNTHDAKTHPIDFERENFNPRNIEHCAYAINDTAILSHAVHNACAILEEITGIPTQNTIGKLGVRFFQKMMPDGVLVWNVPQPLYHFVQGAKRGGYVFCRGRYRGPSHYYDINQSYTHQQRKPLPSGRCITTKRYMSSRLGIYLAAVRYVGKNKYHAPLYAKRVDERMPRMHDGKQEITVYLTTPEIEAYRSWGWQIDIQSGIYWTDSFTMQVMADWLEAERTRYGPKTPKGLMVKAIGNNAYGKTSEEHDGTRYIFCAEQPDDSAHLFMPELPECDTIWLVHEQPEIADYQKGQIAAYITAYARLQVAAVLQEHGQHILYADTDSIISDIDISATLDIHPSRYGAWKIEGYAPDCIIINKKVYAFNDTLHCKGLHIDELSFMTYVAWYETGQPPQQTQRQRLSIMNVFSGKPMFRQLQRKGSFALPAIESEIAD